MPERRAVIQLGLLLLAVPAQYIVSRWYSTTAGQRSTALKEFMTVAAGFQEKYLSWRSWQEWCLELLDNAKLRYSKYPFKESEDVKGETPAIEVFELKEPNGYYTRSVTVRSPRPDKVKYRVGQVIIHREKGYRGVIIGWDAEPQAPRDWLISSHPKLEENVHSMPFYAILVHTQDRSGPQLTYVAQEYIYPIYRFMVQHPHLHDYMDSFDGMRYISRPWLRVLYPHD